MDIVKPSIRSKMMSGIRSKNTAPEIMIRKALHLEGFRYRTHTNRLPGKPDIILPKYNAAIFINGCFWHCHDCHLFKWPSTRPDFWKEKITKNKNRDKNNITLLLQNDWRVMVVWECSLKGKTKIPFDQAIDLIKNWILVGNEYVELTGG